MLKEEISESLLRLKAAKFGRKIEEITPQYDDSFYLPDRAKIALPPSLRTRTLNPLSLSQVQSSNLQSSNPFKKSGVSLASSLESPLKLGSLYRQTLHD